MGRRRLHVLVFCFSAMQAGVGAFAQTGLNNLWLLGYNSDDGIPYGGTNIDFVTGVADIYYQYRDIGFGRTAANISSNDGTLLFSTNGAFLANVNGDTLLNGTDLSPSTYSSIWSEGLHVVQATLILPKPDVPDVYFLLHGTLDDNTGPYANFLYLSVIDMTLDGGLGGVVEKNVILISDQLNIGRITAVRHANGRDWWILCHKANTSIFYRLIATPNGVSVDGTQSIGIVRPGDAGQSCFSPDGGKYAYYWGEEELDVFNFDRCSGMFSDAVHIVVPDPNAGPGVAFSPNSRFLYVSSVEDVYQYDMQAPDIEATMVHIATWDGFYSPGPPFATLFDVAQLAPDGKIYIATGNGTDKLHVINEPDQLGLACDIQQHAITLPTYNFNSLPNHPNYHLGPVDGSVCDSLGINVVVAEEAVHGSVAAYPNPSTGSFTLSYAPQPVAGDLEVRDLSGRLVLKERLPPWSQVHRVELRKAAGMYQCRMSWGTRSAAVRVLIER